MLLVFWNGHKKTLSQTESDNKKSTPLVSFAIWREKKNLKQISEFWF